MIFSEVLKLFKKVERYLSLDSLTPYQTKQLSKTTNKLQLEYSKAAKRANVRLKALEKAGYTSSPAYQRATWFTGETRDKLRFTESKHLNYDELRTAYEEVNIFLQSPASTITSEKERRSGIEKILPKADRKTKAAFQRFLSSNAFEELKKVIGTDIVKKGADAIENGAKVSDLNRLFNNFMRREEQGNLSLNQDIFSEVWSTWTGDE